MDQRIDAGRQLREPRPCEQIRSHRAHARRQSRDIAAQAEHLGIDQQRGNGVTEFPATGNQYASRAPGIQIATVGSVAAGRLREIQRSHNSQTTNASMMIRACHRYRWNHSNQTMLHWPM